jgi:hypothetical protein
MDEREPPTPDLRSLIDSGPAVPAGVDALREVVARRDRSRSRILGIGLALAVVAGPAAGYAVGQAGGSATTPVTSAADKTAGQSAAAPQSAAVAGGAIATGPTIAQPVPGLPNLPKPTQLFLRDTSDGIRIRAYLQDFSKIAVASPNCPAGSPVNGETPTPCPTLPKCLPSLTSIDSQVSNDQVAGQLVGAVLSAPTEVLDVVGAGVVGVNDPTPIGTVIVHTGAGVATVRLTVPGSGTDQMAPVQGDAVLARGVAGLTPASPVTPYGPGSKLVPKGGATPPAAPGNRTGTAPTFARYVGFGFPANTKVDALDGSGNVLATVTLPGSEDTTGGSVGCLLPPGKGGPVPAPGAVGGGGNSATIMPAAGTAGLPASGTNGN